MIFDQRDFDVRTAVCGRRSKTRSEPELSSHI